MVVKRVLSRAGLVDPVKVDLVLDPPDTYPGAPARGRIELVGGQAEARVTVVDLRMRTRVWKVDAEGDRVLVSEVWGTYGVGGDFTLAPREERTVPFTFPLPLQASLTRAWGAPLPKAEFSLVARARLAWSLDATDTADLHVHPLPVQQAVLDTLHGLGLRPSNAEAARGTADSRIQELDFHQVLEFAPGPGCAVDAKKVELILLPGPDWTGVYLKVRRGGLLPGRKESLRIDLPPAGPIDPHTAQRISALVRDALV
ncbi:sporulation protein [Nocardiopsis sp. RSe5-2]|uniref:Sporulation protein n=1 Tax=Nocardiopsis endophytica TaxID=3018445 RepID=A0ABT4UAI7_9ACTN|nr:sporulation protein [Nocardiopsis endophytica]MDA2813410.1 sporulation protein [Nocardiopsis endophytica]